MARIWFLSLNFSKKKNRKNEIPTDIRKIFNMTKMKSKILIVICFLLFLYYKQSYITGLYKNASIHILHNLVLYTYYIQGVERVAFDP